MGMKEDIIAAIQDVADQTGNTNIRVALGKFGEVLKLSTGSLEDTGQALDERNGMPKIFSTIIGGIAAYLSSAGGVGPKPIRTVNATATVVPGESIIQIGSIASSVVINLPKAADFKAGNFLLVKDLGFINAVRTLTIEPNGSETIDGQASRVYGVPYAACWIYSDGEQWLIASSN